MKIGIHREFTGGLPALGGAEYSVAALAEAFEGQHDVEVIHDIPSLTPERVEELFGIPLRRTRFCYEKGSPLYRPEGPFRSRLPWGKYREASRWNAHLSEPYDLFICLSHFLPPFCHARDGLLIILFPMVDRSTCWPWNAGRAARRPGMVRGALDAVHDRIWRDRFRSYRHRYANSEFTRRWTRRYWDVECGVLYPPVDVRARGGEKRSLILSIGRISPLKKQLTMVETFASMARRGVGAWSYQSAGGLGEQAESRAYFEDLRRAAGTAPVELTTNPRRSDLESLLCSAKLFWHATGYGEDEASDPGAMEHFGITTVEAMAWGCVPVVINRGGQPEIVRQGIDGFLWDTLEELEHYTRLLMDDEALRASMSESARSRAKAFSKQRFVDEVAARCGIRIEDR